MNLFSVHLISLGAHLGLLRFTKNVLKVKKRNRPSVPISVARRAQSEVPLGPAPAAESNLTPQEVYVNLA